MTYSEAISIHLDRREEFCRGETRNGYYISGEMKRVWYCQISLLLELQRVCEKYSLRYWLESGTLLGAVRDKGFIPWDDDIDVCMLREDYDRLVSIAQEEFRNPYIFQTAYAEKHFVRGHGQLRDMRTTAILPSEIWKDFNQGVFIDVFVLDKILDDEEGFERQRQKALKIRKKLNRRARPWKRFDFIKGLFRSKRMYRRYEDIFRQNSAKDCSCVSFATFRDGAHKRNIHIYDGSTKVDFEYLKQPAPSGYDELLRLIYGDYMKPAQAPSSHGTVIFDMDTPADVKIKELRKEKKRCKQ